MSVGRIYFPQNPWPAGHPITEFTWSCKAVGNDAWFDFNLLSADYDAELEVCDDPSITDDWRSPIVWGNFHSCILSSTYWSAEAREAIRGVRCCALAEYDPGNLDGVTLEADPLPIGDWDSRRRAFLIYLLGHDTVAGHSLRFIRAADAGTYDIVWTGRIALTYGGQRSFDHEFRAEIARVPAPQLKLNR
jgi:hypothetical protein